jgi:hypothetical protein
MTANTADHNAPQSYWLRSPILAGSFGNMLQQVLLRFSPDERMNSNCELIVTLTSRVSASTAYSESIHRGAITRYYFGVFDLVDHQAIRSHQPQRRFSFAQDAVIGNQHLARAVLSSEADFEDRSASHQSLAACHKWDISAFVHNARAPVALLRRLQPIRFLQADSEVFRSCSPGHPFHGAQRNRGSFTIFSDALHYDFPVHISSQSGLRASEP